MNLLTGCLLVVMASGMPVSAGTAMPAPDGDVVAATAPGFAWSVPSSYSFEDIVNLPAGAGQLPPSSRTADRLPEEAAFELLLAGYPLSARDAGALPAADAAFSDLTAVIVQQALPAVPAAGFLFATDELPEPAGWVALLCGLAAMAFMARRKHAPFTG